MYQTIYDVRESIPWDAFGFVAFGPLIIGVGYWTWLLANDRIPQRWVEVLERLPRRKPPTKKSLRTSSYVTMAFGVLWLVLTSIAIGGGWLSYGAALDSGEHELVEGLVEDFAPAGAGDGSTERFSVNEVEFSYSQYELNPAFRTPRSKGSPIREGLPVRIAYVARAANNAILKLEIPANEPATSEEESGNRHLLPFGVFVLLLFAMGCALFWLLFLNRNAALKRLVFPAPVLLGTALFIYYDAERNSSPVAIIALVGILLFNLWLIRFCDACGATVLPRGSWKRPSKCNDCGHTLGS